MTLELHATPEEVMRAVAALLEQGRARRIPENVVAGMALALEECGSNIVNHALGRDPERTFRVTIGFSTDRITVELRDSGVEFDPTRMGAAAEAADDLPPGGWGIYLARRNTDAMSHTRQQGENVLLLTKNLAPGG